MMRRGSRLVCMYALRSRRLSVLSLRCRSYLATEQLCSFLVILLRSGGTQRFITDDTDTDHSGASQAAFIHFAGLDVYRTCTYSFLFRVAFWYCSEIARVPPRLSMLRCPVIFCLKANETSCVSAVSLCLICMIRCV